MPYIWNRLDQLPGRKYRFDITQINWTDIIRLTGYPMRIKWVEFRFFFFCFLECESYSFKSIRKRTTINRLPKQIGISIYT